MFGPPEACLSMREEVGSTAKSKDLQLQTTSLKKSCLFEKKGGLLQTTEYILCKLFSIAVYCLDVPQQCIV